MVRKGEIGRVGLGHGKRLGDWSDSLDASVREEGKKSTKPSSRAAQGGFPMTTERGIEYPTGDPSFLPDTTEGNHVIANNV